MTMPVSVRRFDAGRIKGPVVIASAIEVDLVWNLANGKLNAKTVLGGIVGSGFTPSVAIAQAIYAAIIASGSWTAWAAYMHTTAAFAGVWLRDLRPPGSFPYIHSTGGPTAGTGAGSALSSALAVVVNLPTNFAGRAFRGRAYLPGLDSGAEVAGTGLVLGLANTAAVNFMIEVQTALTAQSITLGIKQPGRQAYTGVVGTPHIARNANITPVTTPKTSTLYFGSQRRRSQA